MTQPPPAGWYPDEKNPGSRRYWDGTNWIEQVDEPANQQAPANQTHNQAIPNQPALIAPDKPAQGVRKSRPWIWIVSAAAVVIVAVSAALVWGLGQMVSLPGVAGGFGQKVRLSDADFYQRNLEWLQAETDSIEKFTADPLNTAPSFGGVRVSPGYLAATHTKLTTMLDELKLAGNDEFESQDAAESYAYETLTSQIDDIGKTVRNGGIGTELETDAFAQIEAVTAVEQKIAAAPVTPNSEGSYLDTANEIAAIAGKQITTDVGAASCGSQGDNGHANAFVCLGDDKGQQVITFTETGMSKVNTPSYIDTLKHEIAHQLIFTQCGVNTTGTKWGAEMNEAVTNSYAVFFLGADRAGLSENAPPEYLMSDASDAKARAIHASDLACYDNDILPSPTA